MRRSKPVRIRRNRNYFGRRHEKARRILRWVLGIAAVFAVGLLIAKPGIDLASRLWYSHRNAGSGASASASSAPQSEAVSSETVSSSSPASSAAVVSSTGGWAAVTLGEADTAEKAKALAATLKSEGVTSAVLTLKDDRGYLYYESKVALAKNAISATTIDAKAIAAAFRGAGITPVARLCAFRDQLAPYADRTTAVKYMNEDIIWLDSSQELGGKPWLNPNSSAAQQYIADLIAEVRDLGFGTVLIDDLQFPSGYSLDLAGYGTLTSSKQDLLAQVGKSWQSITGVEVWFEFPAAAVSGTDVASYGASPASFGLERVFVRLDSVTAADGTVTAPASDAAALASLQQALRTGGSLSTGLRASGLSSADALTAANTAAAAAGFVSWFTVP